MPRGRALGYTQVMPSDDKYSVTANELLDQLVYAMGGRAAEEIIFDDPTSGASNDIEKATAIARRMVTEYGMSDLLGTVRLGKNDDGALWPPWAARATLRRFLHKLMSRMVRLTSSPDQFVLKTCLQS